MKTRQGRASIQRRKQLESVKWRWQSYLRDLFFRSRGIRLIYWAPLLSHPWLSWPLWPSPMHFIHYRPSSLFSIDYFCLINPCLYDLFLENLISSWACMKALTSSAEIYVSNTVFHKLVEIPSGILSSPLCSASCFFSNLALLQPRVYLSSRLTSSSFLTSELILCLLKTRQN